MGKLKVGEVNYLINTYNWSREDQLANYNWRKILYLLEKEEIFESFLKYNKEDLI